VTFRGSPHLPPPLTIGAALFGTIVFVAVLSFVWLPYDPLTIDIPHRLLPPSLAHPFGTDAYGRDVLSNVIAGGRVSLAVAFFATLLGAGAGVPVGLLAAAARGPIDEGLARVNDVVFAFPALLIAALMASIAGPGAIDAVAAIGIFNIPVFARVTRAAAIGQLQRDYVPAAIAAGKTRAQIVWEHVLPNLLPGLLVLAAIQFSVAILAEAGLAYVGLGAQPPAPDWGRMLEAAQTLIATAPWLAIFPGLAILLTALALNLLSDGFRELLDPRRQRPGTGAALAGEAAE
jgi:peptide/nickel transport system permease protein